MKKLSIALLAAASAACVTASGVSAAVVCNDDGDCWRTKEKYEYRPELKLRIYDDNWRWEEKENNKYRWRESRNARGYWSKGIWLEF